jgi:hypothetical protein
MNNWYSYPNRVVCSVLEEMRDQLKILRQGRDSENLYYIVGRYLPSMEMLVEEAQTLVNRMEAGLEDWSDLRKLREEIKKEQKSNE